MKTGILLINLGTPDSPATKDVRKYLTEFLNDPRVIDISAIGRFLLVNLIIVPFRSAKSAKLYSKIWTKEGSPLLFHGLAVKEKLQKKLGNDYIVEFGMRYQNPELAVALNKLKKQSVDKIIVLPMYPQYASSSTGSTIQKVYELIKDWQVTPTIEVIGKFYDHPAFIKAFASVASKYNHADYDHVVFSYHGLPERQITKASDEYCSGTCSFGACCNAITKDNAYCYRAACFETTRQLIKALHIPEEKTITSFQSRLGKTPWIKPYSDLVIEDLAKQGKKKLLVFSPAFVADCLETIYEIGVEYNEIFTEHGGEKVQLVESLNSNDVWIDAMKEILLDR